MNYYSLHFTNEETESENFNQHKVTGAKQQSQDPTQVCQTSRTELLRTDRNLLVINSQRGLVVWARGRVQPSTGRGLHHLSEENSEGKP